VLGANVRRLRVTLALGPLLGACVQPGSHLGEPPTSVAGATLVSVALGEAPSYATRHRYVADGGLEADLRVARVGPRRPEGAPRTPEQVAADQQHEAALGMSYWTDNECGDDLMPTPDAWRWTAADTGGAVRSVDRPWSRPGAPYDCRRPSGWTARWGFTLSGGGRRAVLRIDAPIPSREARRETVDRVERLARTLLAPMRPASGG
jgi:hypothetical protein